MGRCIGIDWGTTNRRIMVIEDGAIIQMWRDDRGASAMDSDDFAAAVATIRQQLGDLPLLMAGMVGSTVGWREAPYVPTPAGPADLAAAALRIDARTYILPGVSRIDGARSDVMRGEEVQVLGALAAGLASADALFVQPGTHCKWVTVANGRIVDLVTAMTGEMFALLRDHSILRAQLVDAAALDADFHAGVARARDGDLVAALFGIRAGAVLGLSGNGATSCASGLLIGADVAARLARSDADTIYLLADEPLGTLYAAAIAAHGRTPVRIDSAAAFAAGIQQVKDLMA